jgi:hypothetical protein
LEFYRPGEIANVKTSALLLFGFLLCAASAFSQTESDIRDKLDKGGHFAAWEQPKLLSERCARASDHYAK